MNHATKNIIVHRIGGAEAPFGSGYANILLNMALKTVRTSDKIIARFMIVNNDQFIETSRSYTSYKMGKKIAPNVFMIDDLLIFNNGRTGPIFADNTKYFVIEAK